MQKVGTKTFWKIESVRKQCVTEFMSSLHINSFTHRLRDAFRLQMFPGLHMTHENTKARKQCMTEFMSSLKIDSFTRCLRDFRFS